MSENQIPESQVVESQAGGLVQSTPLSIIKLAVEKDLDTEKLRALLAMQDEWQKRQARAAYYGALAELRSKLPELKRTEKVRFRTTKGGIVEYTYVPLGEALAVLQPVLAECGFSLSWRTETDQERIKVTCILAHREGHAEETSLIGPPDTSGEKAGYHALGSAVTYLQRYTLFALLGIAAVADDDGAAANAGGTAAEYVTEEQAHQLRTWVESLGIDAEKFLMFARAGVGADGKRSFARIPASEYERCVAALQAKERQLKS